MRLLILAAITMAAIQPACATCADDINRALPQARALPDPKGRDAVLEEIERARISRHEGDENACVEQMQEVFAVMKPPAPAKK